MTIAPFALAPENYPAPLHVIGVNITVLAQNDTTAGCEMTLQEGGAGAGPPPHSHAWDEFFYVLKGTVEFTYADHAGTASPGTVHHFRFGAEGGKMIEITGKGGSATKLFTALDREIAPGPPDIPAVIGVLQRHGVNVAAA